MTEALPRSPRILVLCFDGTSNEYDTNNTNVVKFFALLKKGDRKEQLCFYQPGIGTWYEPGVVSPLLRWAARGLDLAFATYLDTHVIDGYKFLMQNYTAGDKICIFGFSRGAYTARALGGFVYKVGLLPKDNNAQVQLAYKMYKRTDEEGLKLCGGFKQTYCQDVEVDFMGVWDTVASAGVLAGRTLPFTTANSGIKVFRHALALDEVKFRSRDGGVNTTYYTQRRAKFRPNNYYAFKKAQEDKRANTQEILREAEVHIDHTAPTRSSTTTSASSGGSIWNFFARSRSPPQAYGQHNFKQRARKPVFVSPADTNDVREVWFVGCHGDIGGGSVPNQESSCLSNISLRWMVHEVIAADCGIKFDPAALERAKINNSPEPSKLERELDNADALRSRHCQLKKSKTWWILELMPLHYSWQDPDGVWHRDLSIHMGHGRKIGQAQPLFHSTVKTRMESNLGYSPKAKWTAGSEVYVL
ncbi:hypothetical protein CPB83DRAFT_846025 [Crepidotus variabilis]|uniref:T6SS Phospholipase effector Tle1-like catalytic domain-containing protein n=1 Tax=Crepidotus variabilis TaxID=179855 RepID=A0A9P6JV70_9AGAR|nr:hypothetical protein CPB83DRAFT_846025 [Crepidotus variabilis]